MENFNKDRFLSYARYDLAANKVFYRKAALIILLAAVGSTLLNVITKANVFSDFYMDPQPSNYYIKPVFTMMTLIGYLIGITITMDILAGCWAHNMRTKQGRISMLTLPASMMEKYVWHTGFMVVGGIIYMALTLALVECLNVVLMACMTGHWMWSNSALLSLANEIEGAVSMSRADVTVSCSILAVTVMLCACALLVRHMLFAVSNAVLYKHNVLITYGALIGLSCIGNMFAISVFTGYSDQMERVLNALDNYTEYNAFMTEATVGCIVLFGVAAALWWLGYKLFEKAQLCNKWNK